MNALTQFELQLMTRSEQIQNPRQKGQVPMSDTLITMSYDKVKQNFEQKIQKHLLTPWVERGLKREVEVGSAIHNSVTMLIDSPEKRGCNYIALTSIVIEKAQRTEGEG